METDQPDRVEGKESDHHIYGKDAGMIKVKYEI